MIFVAAWEAKYIALMFTLKTVSNCSGVTIVNGRFQGNAGVVHQDVESAEEFGGLFHELLRAFDGAEVGVDGGDLGDAFLLRLLDGGHGAVPAARVMEHDVGAFAAELQATPRPMPVPEPVTKTRLPSCTGRSA